METINLNKYLNREHIEYKIIEILTDIYSNKGDNTIKRGIYLYGVSGIGKTTFITKILEKHGFDIVRYDACDIRNKSAIQNITTHTMSNRNVISAFTKKPKPIVIIMDELDGMNNGDKGGLNALIKLVRPKKTKKQKMEDITNCPIICISDYHMDKKIKELMKVCWCFELKKPTEIQLLKIINDLMSDIDSSLKTKIYNNLQGDLCKLKIIYNLYLNNGLTHNLLDNILLLKASKDDTKQLTKYIMNNNLKIEHHSSQITETDRTIVGLLWHENVIDKLVEKEKFRLYHKIVKNICFADYIDRITFQKQIWQFNEMSSLIKTFKNNDIYRSENMIDSHIKDVRFTKVLTKYSTEYNNFQFIQMLSQKMSLDKKDMFIYFHKIQNSYDLCELEQTLEINKLEVDRIYRFLDNITIM